MKTMDFDAIAAARPLNRTAAQVVGRGGDPFVSKVVSAQPQHIHSDTPLPIRQTNGASRRSGSFVDLTARLVGSFRVIGLYAALGGKNAKARWVVRCCCGAYEVRTAKALKTSTEAMHCIQCEHTAKLRYRYSHKNRGQG